MYDYAQMRRDKGRAVNQTIDAPIMIFDYFELSDAFAVLGIILVFGLLIYWWEALVTGLLVVIGVVPPVRRQNEKGIFLHTPYRHLGMSLPGLVNPGAQSRYSD